MLREYVEAIPFVLGTSLVAAGMLWLYASFGPLSVAGAVVSIFTLVIALAVRAKRRRENAFTLR